ncbi:cache domain-containing protein [uncultured Hoeflea sp.]|uniref:cache domain-containing protein n=1 Tax=uncultured Hoeflea sp. TaxID=538666 RepID=UPI0030EDA77C|tara:strand:- start:44559 stop:45002 length:444 start_codon:yes stop_codon:yes gene_type:complete
MKKIALSLLMTATFSTFAVASDYASKDEAQALAQKAAAYLQDNGMEKAAAAFQTQGSEWFDRDLYVFVMQKDAGVLDSHGAKPALVGKNLLGLKDTDGKLFVKELAAIETEGWVDYNWQNPTTSAIEAKSTYCTAVDASLVCVGAYQ